MLRKLSFSLSTGIFFLTEEPDKKKQLPEASTQHFSYLPDFLDFLGISENFQEFQGISRNFLEFPEFSAEYRLF